jgi:hypothetical protein
VSIGVAIWPDDGDTPAAVLRCADQRLYQAKAEGRDRVIGPTPHHHPRPAEDKDTRDLRDIRDTKDLRDTAETKPLRP